MLSPTQSAAVAPASRLDGIDLLRGAAIWFVLLNHVNMRLYLAGIPYADGLPRQLLASLVWSGQYGVQIFFAVSGFLITSMSLRRWGALQRVDVRAFYAMRLARIAPLLLALLAVLSVLHAAGLQDFVVSPATGGLGRAWFAALTFHINVLEARSGYLPASWDILWSLSVEEIFYLVFPLACRLLGGSRLLLVTLLLALIALGPVSRTVFARGNEIWQEYSYLGGMDAIALGCLTAIIQPHLRLSRSSTRAVGALGLVTLLFVIADSRQLQAADLGRLGLDMSLLAAAACLSIVAAADSQWRSPRILRPLLQLGRRSYEVYLTHMFVVFALFDAFVAWRMPTEFAPLLFAAVILLAAALGALAARVYSEPFNGLLRKSLEI